MSNKSALFSKVASEEIELDDELIYDKKFAALLNEDREIYIENKLYIYTYDGVYVCDIKHEKKLKKHLENRSKGIKTGKNTMISKVLAVEGCDGSIGDEMVLYPVDDNISLYYSCGGGSTSGGSSSSSETTSYPIDIKADLGICYIDGDSIWQKIFGEAETCHDYYDSDHRTKVKFWNQNYLVFSSIGMSAKYQRKGWLGWHTSDNVDYVELGVNHAIYTYKQPVQIYGQIFKNIQSNAIFIYRGKTYNGEGKIITGTPLHTPKFPFGTDYADAFTLRLYLFNDYIDLYDNQGINKFLRDQILNLFKSQQSNNYVTTDLKLDLKNDDIMVEGIVFDNLKGTMTFTVMDRKERDLKDCCATHYLDVNFIVGTEIELAGGSYSFNNDGDAVTNNYDSGISIGIKKIDASSYTTKSIDFYGLVKKGGMYIGKRMVTKTN